MDELLGPGTVVILGVVVLAASVLAARSRIPAPVLLLGAGVLLGLVPALRTLHLPPHLLLVVLLPALLWWESLTTSLREIRRNLRGIVLTGSVLVVLTAAAVAVLAHAMGLPWGPAWVLGAALAPTDATAVGVLARSLPRRNLTTLRAESLVNDATALVVFAVAVAATVGAEHLTAAHLSWRFVVSYVGGLLAGSLTAWVALRVRRGLKDPLLDNVLFLLTPFVAYLLAELVEASGVLAVVVAGLLMSQGGPRSGRADMRQQANAFWDLSTFLVNGALFVLVGLELHSAAQGLTSTSLARATGLALAVALALVLVRYVFMVATAHLIRLLDRRPQQRDRRISERARVVNTVAGFRGAVSMAVALSVPEVLASGQPFPERDLLLFTTAAVIAVTLVVQAPLLPRVVRWAHLPLDTSPAEELNLADVTATQAGLRELARLSQSPQHQQDKAVIAHLRRERQFYLELLAESPSRPSAAPAGGPETDYALSPTTSGQATRLRDLRLAVVGAERTAVLALRDSGRIDDTVLRRVQTRLDDEELRLTRIAE